jgi:hypothetical protein
MKRCPTCNRIYPDDALSFCLEDGVPLLTVAASDPGTGAANFDPNVTLKFEDPRDTNPPPTQMIDPSLIPSYPAEPPPTPVFPGAPPPTPTASVPAAPPVPQPIPREPSWQTPPTPVVPTPPTAATGPKKSVLPWVLGGGAILLLLGLGVAGILIFAVMSNDNKNNNVANTSKSPEKTGPNDNKNTAPPSNNGGDNTGSFTDDFSVNKWPVGDELGSAYEDGAYTMEQPEANRFFANYAPANDADYSTGGVKSVAIDAEAVSGRPPQYGFGLILHGSINGDKTSGYAFVINAGTKKCSIIQLRNSQPAFITENKAAPMVVSDGANRLEVRLDGKKMDFYINDELTASATDDGTLQGRVGLFTSTGGKVSFDNLEITK